MQGHESACASSSPCALAAGIPLTLTDGNAAPPPGPSGRPAKPYGGEFNSTLTFSGPFGSYTKEQWPAGSAYPDFFVIGDPDLNFYEGSATIDNLRMYVPSG